MGRAEHRIETVDVSAYRVPTDLPESDGTLKWDATTIVLVTVRSGKLAGLGYSYADAATAELVRTKLSSKVSGGDAMNVSRHWEAMLGEVRNLGRPGISSMAVAAVDIALWDLKARLLELPLVSLLGQVRDSVPAYGSGGFTSYTLAQLEAQLGGWVEKGAAMVKMKVGRKPDEDVRRVRAARDAIGNEARLFVDANGAYTRKQALRKGEEFSAMGVRWFEEPVSSDDLEGLHFLRNRVPGGMDVAAGEYGYDLTYFRRMLDAQAVDVLQADATRCAGISGFMQAATLCEAFHVPLSAHTAPSVHLHPCCAIKPVRHVEYFHDHERIEHMFFDGAADMINGVLRPDLNRCGLGLEFKKADAEAYKV